MNREVKSKLLYVQNTSIICDRVCEHLFTAHTRERSLTKPLKSDALHSVYAFA